MEYFFFKLQELVRDMMEADLELMRKDPSA